jgi:hypothetical protein
MEGGNERYTPINVIKGRYTNLIGRTRKPDNMRISKSLMAQTTSISGVEINLFATRRHHETFMMK